MTTATRRPVTPVRVRAIEDGRLIDRPDRLATEEPMEIRVQGPGAPAEAVAVTMRTPGNDFELAVGFCRTEGLLTGTDDLAEVRYCLAAELDAEQEYNVVTARDPPPGRPRGSPPGRRGQLGLRHLRQGHARRDRGRAARPSRPARWSTGPRSSACPTPSATAQTVFEATGGLHAAGLFTPDGELRVLREDVGRHNAVDKIVGHAVLAGWLPLADSVLLVSGRLSFEIVQKAAVAGIPIVAAVSAPSSLAVATAERFGQTLVGFLRDGRCNVYTHPERIDLEGD